MLLQSRGSQRWRFIPGHVVKSSDVGPMRISTIGVLLVREVEKKGFVHWKDYAKYTPEIASFPRYRKFPLLLQHSLQDSSQHCSCITKGLSF